MTPEQREAAERLADRLLHRLTNDMGCAVETASLLRELLAEPQGEPVAWHVCSVNSDGSLSLEFAASWEESAHEHINDSINEYDIDGATSWVVRPVYAAPQQPMRCPTDGGECGAGGYCRPEQRKPLTRDELLSLWKQHGYKSAMCEPFARAVEEAHGITGEPT